MAIGSTPEYCLSVLRNHAIDSSTHFKAQWIASFIAPAVADQLPNRDRVGKAKLPYGVFVRVFLTASWR
jgi:hypothetical protein